MSDSRRCNQNEARSSADRRSTRVASVFFFGFFAFRVVLAREEHVVHDEHRKFGGDIQVVVGVLAGVHRVRN